MVSGKTIGRLSLYRRVLYGLMAEREKNIFSHQLANLVGGTAAQVRRDVMALGYSGSPTHGYDIRELVESIAKFLDAPAGQTAALVGVGNLGRALLAYFSGRRPKLWIEAAFDVEPSKVNRLILGCHCYPFADLDKIVKEHNISVGILTVPAEQAQQAADKLCQSGVSGLLNFAPVRLRVPDHVYVEDIDMTMALEKVAYFARQRAVARER